jgi:outer membrane protein TolC
VAELELREASLGVAERIRDDNRARLEAGRMSELEVRRAEAGVALRHAQVLEARQRVVDLSSLLRIYFGEQEVAGAPGLRPRDAIVVAPARIDFAGSRAAALTSHPGYLARRAQLAQAGLRADYARNQRLPQLDLRASYGYNGLGTAFGDSWDRIAERDFPAWYLGAELRVPILTGVKSANQLRAARARQDAAGAELAATEIELLNLLQAIIRRLASQEGQIAAFSAAAEVAGQVLDAELEALESGRSDSRRVLDAEQDVFEANAALLGARTDYRRSLVEFRSLEGTYLASLGYDLLDNETEKKPFFRFTL